MIDLASLCSTAHAYAVRKGFWADWPGGPYEPLQVKCYRLALIAGEAHEAIDAVRKRLGDEALADELADTVIRIADFCGGYGLDLEGAIGRVQARNESRPALHGKEC